MPKILDINPSVTATWTLQIQPSAKPYKHRRTPESWNQCRAATMQKQVRMSFTDYLAVVDAMKYGIHTARNLVMWKRIVENFMGNHRVLIRMMVSKEDSSKVRHTGQTVGNYSHNKFSVKIINAMGLRKGERNHQDHALCPKEVSIMFRMLLLHQTHCFLVLESLTRWKQTTAHSSHQFIPYNSSPRDKKIKVAEGPIATVAVQGTISLNPCPS